MSLRAAVVLGCFSVSAGTAADICKDDLDSRACMGVSVSSILQQQQHYASVTNPERRPDLSRAASEEDTKGFHCHEALEEWRRGWSTEKITWCCENEGIACEQLAASNPSLAGDLIRAQMPLEESMDVIVEVDTANVSHAGTNTGASMAFEVDESWTEDLDLCSNVTKGEVVARMVRLPMWPTKMRIRALGLNNWGYTSIHLYHTNRKNDTVKVSLLNGTAWNATEQRGNGSRYWVDGLGSAPKENTYIVPALPEKYSDRQHCTTRTDSRINAMGYTTSPEGTECIFGLDERDEGHHCIQETGDKYGSFGWCYTSTDMGSWGACSANCPLSGQNKVLGTKIDEVLRRLNTLKEVPKLVTATTSTVAVTTAQQATPTTGSAQSTATAPSVTESTGGIITTAAVAVSGEHTTSTSESDQSTTSTAST